MKKISIVTPCYNEEGNVYNMFQSIKRVFESIENYEYEHIFIDNCSTDRTGEILCEIAEEDARVKVILNARNFGPGRSGGYALLQAKGDAVIGLACDFQEPPELIPDFIKKWEEGYKVVFGQKSESEESKIMFSIRTLYYKIIKKASSSDQLENVTGFGLYDKEVIKMMRWIDDPNPYFRGTIAELGYEVGLVQYVQPKRRAGKSSYNLFRYIDTAINGMINSSQVPLRIASYVGFIMSAISFIIGIIYFMLKIIYWNSFNIGIAPLVIGLFFLGSIQLAFIGVLGEYIGAILTRVTRRPLVVEKKRINFENNIESEVNIKVAERV
ncbi:glycosyltransferase family 2 protein [Clostridium sp. CTA-7]